MRKYKLTISRSLRHITGQVTDSDGKVVATATSKGFNRKQIAKKNKRQISAEVGKELAKKLKAKKIKMIWFDRKGQKYHGRIAKMIEALRKEGIK